MTIDSNIGLEPYLLACPFSHACNLPKNQNTCHFPEYKMCPEHDNKLFKLKASMKILH